MIYRVVKEELEDCDLGIYYTYGIECDGRIIHDVSTDPEKVAVLAEMMMKGGVSPVHFKDVVEDFVVT